MGPGFKYHVVTIVAIFLALTVGLVVGSLTLSPYNVQYYRQALRSLKAQQDRDLNDKSQEIERYRKFFESAMPLILSGKLDGQTVAIVQTGDYSEDLDGIRDALGMAGAQVVSVTTIERSLARPDELLGPILAALHNDDPRVPSDRNAFFMLLAKTLCQGDTDANGLMPVLEKADLVSLNSDNSYQIPARCVVLLAGSRLEGADRPANVDQPLAQALQKLNVPVVMCESERAFASDVPAYHALNLDVPTVDNIDSDIGKVSLVFALRGAKDDYGVKPAVGGGSKNLMPPLTTK